MDNNAVLPPVSSPGLPSSIEADECSHSPFLSGGFDFQLDGIDLRTAYVFKRASQQRFLPDRFIEFVGLQFPGEYQASRYPDASAEYAPGRTRVRMTRNSSSWRFGPWPVLLGIG